MADTPHDRISIHGIVVSTIVGVLPHEREIAQPIRVDVDLLVDLHDAGRSDELADTVNYGEVAVQIASQFRESKDVLLERLADRAAEIALGFERVESVEVTVAVNVPEVLAGTVTTMVPLPVAGPLMERPPVIEKRFEIVVFSMSVTVIGTEIVVVTSSVPDWLAMAAMTGGSFTAVTLTV